MSMKGFGSVYRKEMYSLFASPIFYVVGFVFLVIAGYFFYSNVAYYNLVSFQASQNPFAMSRLNLTEMVLGPFFLNISIVLLFMAPLLTMRLYAEERKTGTMELLFTYPISDRAAILAKFAAVLSAFVIILAGTLPGMVILHFISDPNWKVIFSGYMGLILMGGAFLALGVFTSSITQNQIIAAVLSFGLLLMFWIIGWTRAFVGEEFYRFIEYLTLPSHLESFTRGVLDSRDIVFYLLFMLFFLFLTQRQVESYRWRG